MAKAEMGGMTGKDWKLTAGLAVLVGLILSVLFTLCLNNGDSD